LLEKVVRIKHNRLIGDRQPSPFLLLDLELELELESQTKGVFADLALEVGGELALVWRDITIDRRGEPVAGRWGGLAACERVSEPASQPASELSGWRTAIDWGWLEEGWFWCLKVKQSAD